MTASVIPLPFKGDLIDYLQLNGRKLECLWRDREAYVPVRPICEQLNIDWKSQYRKLTSPESEAVVVMMTTSGADGKQYEMVCLAYPDFMTWLANLTVSKVKPAAQAALRHLKREIKTLIANYYRERLFGDVVMRDQASESFAAEWCTQYSWRAPILMGGRAGWDFKQIVAACKKSTPVWRIADDARKALSLGFFTQVPAGLPAPRVVLTATPADDPRQMPLFGQV